MTTSFDKINQFQMQYLPLSVGKTPEEVKKTYPVHKEVNGRIQEAKEKALEALEDWQKTPRGRFGGLKRTFNRIGNCFRRMVKKPETTVGPKVAAEAPHKFEKISEDEKQALEKKAKLYETLAKVLLIIGAVLLGLGILAPVAMTPLLFILPEVLVITIIAAGALTGVAGTASMVAYPFLKNSNPIKEHRAKTDTDFQQFVERYVQAPKDPDQKVRGGAGFNVNAEDLRDTKLHKIYLEWKKSVDEALDESQQKKLEKER